MSGLSVPDVSGTEQPIRAALAYAAAGWYVIPVAADTKAPTVLGKGWPKLSSRDPEEIVSWFAGTDYALGLHVGRSGAVVFDVDSPADLPADLRAECERADVPFQSTRDDEPGRGHYVFAVPAGRLLGNSRGEFGKAWGEVRGNNGIIVVSPSRHTKAGGRYHWERTGPVPVLPQSLSARLPDGTDSSEPASDAAVEAFMAEHTGRERPSWLIPVVESLTVGCREKGSRHEALVTAMSWAMREAVAGMYPAAEARDALWEVFSAAMVGERDRYPRSEFRNVLAWAVAQAPPPAEAARRASDTEARLNAAAAELVAASAPAASAPAALAATPQAPPTTARQRGFTAADPGAMLGAARNPAAYFEDKTAGIDIALLAQDILDRGPLAWGRDDAFWSYQRGVWRSDAQVVVARATHLLQGRWRGAHGTNAETFIRHRVPTIDCEPHPDLMNFANGMLDWRTGELTEHSPDYGSSVQFPYEWTPDAACPRFETWLSETLDPDHVTLAWEMLGYLMYSGNPKHLAFMLLGDGGNGKSTLIHVIQALLGTANVSSATLDSLNTNRFAGSQLFSKIANIAGDIDATYQESTAGFKMLTGGDLSTAERKFREPFQFLCWAVPLFSANKVPGSADVTQGYLRRWVVLHFARSFVGREIPNLSEQLVAEIEGIAVKAVEALRRVMQGEKVNFSIVGTVEKTQEQFKTTLNQVRQWIEDACEPDDKAWVKRDDLYASYKAWAIQQGNRGLSAASFYGRLDDEHYDQKKRQGVRGYTGLRVKAGRMQAHPQMPVDAEIVDLTGVDN